MRVRTVTTFFGLGAIVLLCLAPESAQAQRRRGNSGPAVFPAAPAVFGQPWQPGYSGAPAYYGPGTAYGPGVSYGPGMSYAPGVTYGMGTVPLPERAGVAGMSYAPGVSYGAPMYQPQQSPGMPPPGSPPTLSYGAPMYQPQQYPYPQSTAPCPPGQPLPQSALTSPAPQAMPSGAPGSAPGQPTPYPAPGSAPGQPAAAQTVNAQDDYFEPKTLNIQPGATVTWVNRGQHAHTVTFDVGRDSGDIAPGGSFSATFPHAGTYHYHCHHHKDMRGTVVVGEGGTGGSGSSTGAKY